MYSDVFCKVYNEFGWNYYPEAFGEQLLQWLKNHHVPVRTALDLACGTGVLCRSLKAAGIDSRGMDFSEGMIAIARSESPDIPYDVADMTVYRPDAQFDLVTCTGDALNHIPQLSDVGRIFENVYAYLAPGGYFIFDLLTRTRSPPRSPSTFNSTSTSRPGSRSPVPQKTRSTCRPRSSRTGSTSSPKTFLRRSTTGRLSWSCCAGLASPSSPAPTGSWRTVLMWPPGMSSPEGNVHNPAYLVYNPALVLQATEKYGILYPDK